MNSVWDYHWTDDDDWEEDEDDEWGEGEEELGERFSWPEEEDEDDG